MLKNRMEILNEELKNIKEKLRKTENENNDLNDEGKTSLRKIEKEIIQEEKKVAWNHKRSEKL